MNTEKIPPILRRTWAEIDLDAAAYNFTSLRKMAAGKLVSAVIKADAYGHGAVRLARLYSELGADFFAVSNLDEALELRRSGITLPILVLGYVHPESAPLAAEYDVTLTVYSLEYARALSEALSERGKSVKIHLKFDTGMGRLGFLPELSGDGGIKDCIAATRLSGLLTDGAFTHFAVADGGADGESREYTKEQARRFAFAISELRSAGVTPRIKHVSNSAAVLDYPELAVDMVRLGISLYGLHPSAEVQNPFVPRPVMTLKSVISHVKTVKAGTSISYGRTFKAPADMRVGTVPVGYADGFLRASSTEGVRLTVGGRSVPILGRVCMDQLMIDLSDTDAKLLDEVTVFGKDACESADTYAEKCGTIGYECVCAVGRRVPRVYLRNGSIESVAHYLE